MPRLPQPGADQGQWGTILNDFLAQSHNTDGSLKAGVVKNATIEDNGISEVKLDSSVRTKLNTVGGTPLVESVAGKTGAVTLDKSDVGLGNVDNTSDVAKPISSATQTALNAKANATHTHGIADVTNLQATLDSKLATTAAVQLTGDQTISGVKNFTGTLQSGGQAVVATNDSRLTDQRIPTDGSVTVSKLSAGPANSDQVLSYDGSGLAWTTITPEGFITDASAVEKGIVQLAGDLAGTAGSPVVAKVNGIAVSGTPSTGQVLTATSSSAANWQTAPATTVASTNITDATATGRSVLTAADAAAARTALGLNNVNNTSDVNKPISNATQSALDAAAAAVPETVRDTMATALVAGANVTITPNDGADTITISASGGGGGGGLGANVINAVDYGVIADGTTDNRTAFTAAIAAAVALASTGKAVVLQLPSGIINTTSAMSGAYTDPNGVWMSNVLGYGLPVNLTGHLTIRGTGEFATTFKLSNNCRNAFWINQTANRDIFRNITFENFGVDYSAVTSMARGHGIIGNRPYNNQFQKYLNYDNLTHRRLRLFGVAEDPNMTTTSIIGVLYLGQQNGDWEAGVTPGSLPLKPFVKSTAAADGWTYSLDIVFEDCTILDARGALQVPVLVNNYTTHYVDRIRMTRCVHWKATYTEATATAFYVTGLGGFDGIVFEGCSTTNVGDDGIEIGGGQRYIIRDFTAVNSRLEGIYLRTWLMPLDPDNTSLDIDNYTFRINEDATTGTWPVNGGTRVIRGVPLQVDFTDKTNDTDAYALPTQLASLHVNNMRTIIEGGNYNQIVRGTSTNTRVGLNFDGHVKKSVFENCKAVYRNVYMTYSSGDYIVSMLNIHPQTFESGVIPQTTVRDFEAIFENVTTAGARFEVRGIETGGNGDITIDGFKLTIKNVPSAAITRAGLAYPGWVGGTVRNLSLRRLSGEVIGTYPTVRRGIVLTDDGTIDNLVIDENDFSAFGANGDITWTPGIGPVTNVGTLNRYQLSANGGNRVPTAVDATLRVHESVIAVTSTAAARTITLPALANAPVGRVYSVIDESNAAATNNITIARAGSDTWLGGGASKTISTNGGSIRFYSNGTVWVQA